MIIQQKLESRMQQVKSFLCVGLDSDLNKLSSRFLQQPDPQFAFNRWIIEQTNQYVCAYKPNLAFYEAQGEAGWRSLRLTMEYLRNIHPNIVTIADAKRADIDSTNLGYVQAIYDNLGFDAVTLHPYLGQEALQPFLDRKDKACIILVKTSNSGSGEFQDLMVNTKENTDSLWEFIAKEVAEKWNANQNCWLVIGATYPKVLRDARAQVGDLPFLIPGIGAQGGDLNQVLKLAKNSRDLGMIINSSRGVIFAENPANEAQQLQKVMAQVFIN